MNQNNREFNYLKKIENDIQERLWDLLIIHLLDVHEKIKKSGQNKVKLIELLDKAVVNLRNNVSNYNRLSFYRYILIICNKILKYDVTRKDLKNIKKEIIDDYTHSDHDTFLPYLTGGKVLSLANQVNEVRITYDTGYLNFLIQKFIKEKEWDNALYCLITVGLIEPDNGDLAGYYKEIRDNSKSKKVKQAVFENPKEMVLALDSNVVISKVIHDVGEYRIKSEPTFDLEKLGNYNKFVVTDSVAGEVRKHLEFVLVGVKRFCRENHRFKYEEIEGVLRKRLEKMIEKYGVSVKVPKSLIEKVKEFYLQYLEELEKILLFKIEGKYVSQKLRKLSQRESLLPEEGDLRLLAEVIEMNKEQKTGILSKDKDFTTFNGEIRDKFGVIVYG